MHSDHISSVSADGDILRLRSRRVNRAVSEFRRGVPVLVEGTPSLLALSGETGGVQAMAEMTALSDAAASLIVPASRAAAILRTPLAADGGPVAIAWTGQPGSIEIIRALADPLAPRPVMSQTLHTIAPPPGAAILIRLAKFARLLPVVLTRVVTPEVDAALRERDILRVSASDLAAYQEHTLVSLRHIVTAEVPLVDAPDSRVAAFRSEGSAIEHLAILIGRPETRDSPLVRLHSECFTGDLLGSMRCDCGEQLRGAIRRMSQDGAGVILYLGQEGRGIGLVNKLRAYGLQDRGLDTMDANRALGWGADERNFMIGASMLKLLNIHRMRLLTNNPDKMEAFTAAGIQVTGREPHMVAPNGVNDEYLATKAARFGHMLD